MHPSIRLCFSASAAASVSATAPRLHTPLIHFVGKRTWDTAPAQHPHPYAPQELRARFDEFVSKFRASSAAFPSTTSSTAAAKEGSAPVFEEFWEAPERLWKHELSEDEVDAIMSGGASAY